MNLFIAAAKSLAKDYANASEPTFTVEPFVVHYYELSTAWKDHQC